MNRCVLVVALFAATLGVARAEDAKLEEALRFLDRKDAAAEDALVEAAPALTVAKALEERLNGRDEDVHVIACRALGRIGGNWRGVPFAWEPLLRVLGQHRTPEGWRCREAAARAIVVIAGRASGWPAGHQAELVQGLLPTAWDQRPSVAEAGARALEALTQERRPRDVAFWRAWLDKQTGGKLAPHPPWELLVAVEPRRDGFLVNGELLDRAGAVAALRRLDELAVRANVDLHAVAAASSSTAAIEPLLAAAGSKPTISATAERDLQPPVAGWLEPLTFEAFAARCEQLLRSMHAAVTRSRDPAYEHQQAWDLARRQARHPEEAFRALAARLLEKAAELKRAGARAERRRVVHGSLSVTAILVDPAAASYAIVGWRNEEGAIIETGRIYKEGDTLELDGKTTVALKVAKIEPGRVTFQLDDETFAVEIKSPG